MNHSLPELFRLGGPVMWALLAASILGLAVIIDRVRVFHHHRQNLDDALSALGPLVQRGAWGAAEVWCARRGPLSRVARLFLQYRAESKEIREDVLRKEGLLILSHLEHRLRWLAMLAQVSTLLGLLGTFHVMILRFSQGGFGAAASGEAGLASSIWEALLTTMYGLMIAIPCSATYQILEGRVDALAREMDILAASLEEWLRSAAASPQGRP